MIDVHALTKIYTLGSEQVKALDQVSFKILRHEFTAVVGPSGSGKSTLMHILGCLDIADTGRYILDGQDISDLNDDQLAEIRNRKIGFIFQQFNLLQKLSALENVELPLIYQGLHRDVRLKRARQALEQVGLADRLNHRPNELSGGQQQRVAIARALATDPALILADEPTGNLDSQSSREIIRLLHQVHEKGNTILIITHDPGIAKEAGRRIELMDGRIVADTQPAAGESEAAL
ncbi:MAG: ABC transporter ATP-binding protein [Clostridiaceae bacterium]|nr:ABC transporter ATP-binding protein [Clostridiaceae bacterium]